MDVLLAVIIVLIIIFIFIESIPVTKESYQSNSFNSDSPKIVILAGIHGNEFGASRYLTKLTKDPNFTKGWKPANYVVYPRVNAWGLDNNERLSKDGSDLNRKWPDSHPITKAIVKDIDTADLVIDFHEGWNFSTCNPASMGNSIYTNLPYLKTKVVHDVVPHLNEYSNNGNIPKHCRGWVMMDKLPYLKGALDIYCEDKKIPYMLVEIAGQNNKNVSVADREICAKIVLDNLLGV